MGIIRSIVSVVAGYGVFAITALALFQLTGQKPHQEASIWFIVGSTLYSCVFAFLGGYVAGWGAPLLDMV